MKRLLTLTALLLAPPALLHAGLPLSGAIRILHGPPNESGASNGYVAAGGPGFSGSRDTTGK